MLWSCSEEIDAPLAENAEPQSETAERLSPYDQAAIAISQKAIGSISGTAASRSAAPLLTLKETLRYPAASRGADEEQPVTIYNFNEGGYSVVKNIGGYPELLVYSDKGQFDPADEIPQMLLSMAMDFQDSIPTPKYTVEPVVTGPTRWHYDHICNAKRYYEIGFDIPYFLKTQWHQASPYSCNIYINGYKEMYVGCGPLAVGQVFAYFKHPTSINGRECRWDVYTQTPEVQNTDSYIYELSSILSDIANGCKARYSDGDNGGLAGVVTNMNDILDYLHVSGYNKAVKHMGYDSDIIKRNILLRKPVIILARANTSQHIFILDGFKEENYRDEYYNADTKEYCETIYTNREYFHANFGEETMENTMCLSGIFQDYKTPISFIESIYIQPIINL